MASCTNATARPELELRRTASTKGVLRPRQTAALAHLRRDAAVAPVLQPFVERYWSVAWDLTGRRPFRSEVLSGPSVNLSVETGSSPRFGFCLPAVLLHGVVTRRFSVDLAGIGRVSAVKFRPGGFTAFTGLPPPRDSVAPLAGVRGLDPADLLTAVLAEQDDAARASVLDAALAPLAPEPPRAYVDLLALLAQMLEDRTLVRVEDVAARAAVSARSLQRLFATWVGASPKAVLAQLRLQDAAASIDAGTVDDLAGLAASLGWYDQAHFSRDFRAVVGVTPSAYLRRARADRDLG